MSHAAYASLEPFIVGLIVILCALVVLRRQAPRLWTRLTGNAPRAAGCHDAGEKTACSSGCGSCGSASQAHAEQPVRLHRTQG